MSEYLKLTKSPAEIIAAAQGLGAQGETLAADLERLIGDVNRLDSDKTLGNDEPAREFKEKVYHTNYGQGPTNEATKTQLRSAASGATEYGDAVTESMQDFLITDGQSKNEIDAVQQ